MGILSCWLRTALLLQLFGFIIITSLARDTHEVNSSITAVPTNQSKKSFYKWKSLITKTWKHKQDITQRTTDNPEAFMTTPQIIINRGYPVEIHSVVTDDGYILEVHRIPRSKTASPNAPTGKAIFIQHGFSSGSPDWVISPSERSLAFRLADSGFDVWLGNARGNDYSRKHLFLDPAGAVYWRFSWDETGKYDIPATINYILAQNGQSKLSYIGHSMGCAVFFVAMITHPELNDKIDVMLALAPATNLAHMKSPIRYAAPFVKPIETRVFLPNNNLVHQLQRRFCRIEDRFVSLFCRNQVFVGLGNDMQNSDPALLPVIDYHTPIGTSTRTAAQFAQNYNSGETFIPYNYGWFQNLRRYGRIAPPPYDLSKVTAPVYIFYGPNDNLVVPQDAAWLASQLGNCKANTRVDFALYNHYDFVFATDNNRLLYDQLISILSAA